MSKELLHPGVTTESTYTDIGADTPEGFSISSRSRSLAREMIGNAAPEDRIRQRCSIAVGDLAMADLLRFENDPVSAGLAAVAARCPGFYGYPHGSDRDSEARTFLSGGVCAGLRCGYFPGAGDYPQFSGICCAERPAGGFDCGYRECAECASDGVRVCG